MGGLPFWEPVGASLTWAVAGLLPRLTLTAPFLLPEGAESGDATMKYQACKSILLTSTLLLAQADAVAQSECRRSTALWFDGIDDESISTTLNGKRYPHYSRLDVSFRWQFEKWGGTWQPYLQLVNVYDRRNVWYYLFDYDRSPPIRRGRSQLPVLPSFGVEFKW